MVDPSETNLCVFGWMFLLNILTSFAFLVFSISFGIVIVSWSFCVISVGGIFSF